ncbi:MAG TPA: hypothetical protein VGH74_18995, partial [Planctomycetaceae bacterium]
PVGARSIALTDSSLLKIGSDGGLVLGLAVRGPEKRPETDPKSQLEFKPSYWRIEELSLELTGKVAERQE